MSFEYAYAMTCAVMMLVAGLMLMFGREPIWYMRGG